MDRLPTKLLLSTGAAALGVLLGLVLNALRQELVPAMTVTPEASMGLGIGSLVAAVLVVLD